MEIKWSGELAGYMLTIGNVTHQLSKDELSDLQDQATEALANGCEHELTFFDSPTYGYIFCSKCGMEKETKKERCY